VIGVDDFTWLVPKKSLGSGNILLKFLNLGIESDAVLDGATAGSNKLCI
jgi:hypothetical protein